jgi:hypothetical protein
MAGIETFDNYYILDGFRFPVTKELEGMVEDMSKSDYWGNYQLKNKYFPDNSILAHSIDMYSNAREEAGMTYFHALASEPRLFTTKGLEVYRTTWSGAYFKEVQKWGEEEITKLGELKETVQKSKILEEVASAVALMDRRMKRRLEWLAAQVITKGTIEVTPDLSDNPERLSYTVDFRLKDPWITLLPDQKWDHKDANGNYDADIVRFFWDLTQARTENTGPYNNKWSQYLPEKLLMNQYTYRILAQNKTIYSYLLQMAPNRQDTQDFTPFLMFNEFQATFKRFTGIDIEVYDEGYYDEKTGQFVKFIPNGHVTMFNKGPRSLGEFTYTAHAHGGGHGKGIRVGTGRFLMAEDMTHKANPYYQVVHGFHGLPRLLDYDVDQYCYRLNFMNVLS